MSNSVRTTLNKNVFVLVDTLIDYEKENGIAFNKQGFPIFKKEHFLSSLKSSMIPYTHRNEAYDKKDTIICFYEMDKFLYRKLTFSKLKEVAKNLNEYGGFVGYDLSIFKDFLYPMQKFYILANLVISMFFVLNGNKMIPNLRADQTQGRSYFHLFRDAPLVCCGTLGCSREKIRKATNIIEIKNYCEKHPSQKVIQYGSYIYKAKNTFNYKPVTRKERKKNG